MRPVAISLALIAAGGACTSTDGGVRVTAVETEVEFGAAPTTDEVAPANFGPGPVERRQAQGSHPLPTPFLPPSGSLPDAGCPPAELDAFPRDNATTWAASDHKPVPRAGGYRWKRAGRLKLAATGNREIDVTGFEQRVIRNVEVGDETFEGERRTAVDLTYETVQPEVAGSDVVVTRFRVRSGGQGVRAPSPVDEQEFGAGEPDRGLSLTGIDVFDQRETLQQSFAPATPLLLLPLPVVPGEQFQSVALDPKTGRQLAIEGQVTKRQRIDACGDIIEGWRVESTVTASGGDASYTRQYDYVVATQFGTVLVGEAISQEGSDELHLEFTVAQQDPEPGAAS